MQDMSIKTARKFLAKKLEEPGFRQVYVANIAMCIYDNRDKGRLNHKGCNDVAEKLIDLIFSDKR